MPDLKKCLPPRGFQPHSATMLLENGLIGVLAAEGHAWLLCSVVKRSAMARNQTKAHGSPKSHVAVWQSRAFTRKPVQRGRTGRCAKSRPPPVAMGPRVLNSAPPMLF